MGQKKVNMRTRKARLWKLGKVHALILVKLSKSSDSKWGAAFGEQQTGDDEEDESARWEITLLIIQNTRRLVRCLSCVGIMLLWPQKATSNCFRTSILRVKYKYILPLFTRARTCGALTVGRQRAAAMVDVWGCCSCSSDWSTEEYPEEFCLYIVAQCQFECQCCRKCVL